MSNVIEQIEDYSIVREHGLFDKERQRSMLVLYRDVVFIAAGDQQTLHKKLQQDQREQRYIKAQQRKAEEKHISAEGN